MELEALNIFRTVLEAERPESLKDRETKRSEKFSLTHCLNFNPKKLILLEWEGEFISLGGGNNLDTLTHIIRGMPKTLANCIFFKKSIFL